MCVSVRERERERERVNMKENKSTSYCLKKIPGRTLIKVNIPQLLWLSHH